MQASFDVTPRSGGRFHVTGRVAGTGRADLRGDAGADRERYRRADRPDFRAARADPADWPTLVDEAEQSDEETPDPPEPIENGIIDLGRLATDALFLAARSLSPQAGCRIRAGGRGRRSGRSPVRGAEGAEGGPEKPGTRKPKGK